MILKNLSRDQRFVWPELAIVIAILDLGLGTWDRETTAKLSCANELHKSEG